MPKRITATQLARNLSRVLDAVVHRGEEVVIIRNNQLIARIVPGVPSMTALEAMTDLYQTLPVGAGDTWIRDSRQGGTVLSEKIKDPWDT